jgi:hypothetical protein
VQRVYADFNTMNAYVGYNDHLTDERRRVWLTSQPFFMARLRVVLFQDEDDFEVEGTIEHDDRLGNQEGWYAIIDWATRHDL